MSNHGVSWYDRRRPVHNTPIDALWINLETGSSLKSLTAL